MADNKIIVTHSDMNLDKIAVEKESNIIESPIPIVVTT